MPYGVTGSIEKLQREQIVAVNGIASDVGTTTAAGTTTAQTATVNEYFGKITCLAATTQADSAILTLTITNSVVAAGDLVFASVALSSGAAAAYAIQSVTPGASSIVVIIQNTGAAAWAAPVFLVSFHVVKALSAAVAN